MSRHQPRQKLAGEFDATAFVTERGDGVVARIKETDPGEPRSSGLAGSEILGVANM
jgi:hypothetical protein